MLPKPDCAFKIPSLHDGLDLDGRLYFPSRDLAQAQDISVEGFVILAHPYAPLGGSWDDPVISTVGAVFLKAGYVLITFNFRGAVGSAGSTSWTGNAELADYVAFCVLALFLINQAACIDHTGINPSLQSPRSPTLVLGGYSYGSLIASCLPDVEVLQKSFSSPKVDTVEYKIAMRAYELSRILIQFMKDQEKTVVSHPPTTNTISPSSPSRGLTLGGYEGQSTNRRVSKDYSRKSFDAGRIRRSLDRIKHRFSPDINDDLQILPYDADLPEHFLLLISPSVAFLLVSPLLPPVSSFITLFSQPSFQRERRKRKKMDNLCVNATLAIAGDRDKFTSVHKLRDWSHGIQSIPGSQFDYQIVEGAGHFWIENGAEAGLRNGVTQWLDKLFSSEL